MELELPCLFGNGKKIEDGFVIDLKKESEFANKEIIKIEENLEENRIILAKLMARKYFCNISDCIKLMLPPGTSSKEISNRIKEKTGNFVFLKKQPIEIQELIENKKIKSEKHIRALKFLIQNNGVYKTDLEVLADVSSSIIKTLEKNDYIEIREEQIVRNPFINKNIKRDRPKSLTQEQEKCFNSINYYIQNNEFSRNLIYGITGSRKNRNLLTINRRSIKKE